MVKGKNLDWKSCELYQAFTLLPTKVDCAVSGIKWHKDNYTFLRAAQSVYEKHDYDIYIMYKASERHWHSITYAKFRMPCPL